MQHHNFSLVKHVPVYLSLAFLIFWLGSIVFLYQFTFNFMVGLMVWVVFAVMTAISWKDGLIGGILWLLAGCVYLVVSLGGSIPMYGAIALFLLSFLFMHQYFKDEKEEANAEQL